MNAILELLDAVSPRSVLRDLNEELRRILVEADFRSALDQLTDLGRDDFRGADLSFDQFNGANLRLRTTRCSGRVD